MYDCMYCAQSTSTVCPYILSLFSKSYKNSLLDPTLNVLMSKPTCTLHPLFNLLSLKLFKNIFIFIAWVFIFPTCKA